MLRRDFMRLIGAASLAPTLPAPMASSAVSYNRYIYGLGVFHARTTASLTAADLASKLAISSSQANMMMAEMARKGVVIPLAGKEGAVRAISHHMKPKNTIDLVESFEKLTDGAPETEKEESSSEHPPLA